VRHARETLDQIRTAGDEPDSEGDLESGEFPEVAD